jgi:tripartite-type tricarboxylate transporter receptor subunit TctC
MKLSVFIRFYLWLKKSLTLLSILVFASLAQAQTYPTKPIRFLVGFPPGGGNDSTARMVSVRMAERMGQSVVIDNRPGAGGNLAAEITAKSTPDGYTILLASSSHPIQGLLKKHLTYDPIRDFSSIAILSHYRAVLVVHPAAGAGTVKELVALTKAKPGAINFATAGAGTGGHMATEMFRYLAGVNIMHVPYKGSAQALTDVMSGRVQMMFAPTLATAQHVQAGRLRALGVTSATRSRVMPDVPTIAEAGVAGYAFAAWYGVLAPAGLPAAVQQRLHSEAVRAMQAREVTERLSAEDMDGANVTPAQMDDARRAELAKWTKIVKQLDLRFD